MLEYNLLLKPKKVSEKENWLPCQWRPLQRRVENIRSRWNPVKTLWNRDFPHRQDITNSFFCQTDLIYLKTRTDFVQRPPALTLKIKKRSSKNRGILLIGEIINVQRKVNGSMEEKIFFKKPLDPTQKRNLVWKQRIPPRREIWSGSNGSHPEENLGWENRMEKKKWSWPWPKKVDLGF